MDYKTILLKVINRFLQFLSKFQVVLSKNEKSSPQIQSSYVPYFAMYNEHYFAQIFEGKIRMHIIHG